MPAFLILTSLLATLLLTLSNAQATPVLSFPVNAQLPPVAYVSQYFEFTFLPDTFRTDRTANLVYQLLDGPNWLSIDSNSRTLCGTPTIEDVGATTVQLIAHTSHGVAVDNVTLVILQDRALAAGGNILSELEKAGATSAPASLLLRPAATFSFAISPDIFEGVSPDTRFYAICSNGTPLPAWLQFESSTLVFSGTTPSFITTVPGQQSYSVSLAASNVVGFSEVRVNFQIVIEIHVLAFQPSQLTINSSNDGNVVVPSLMNYLHLDGGIVDADYLTSVVANPPGWLSFNRSDLSLGGVAPGGTDEVAFNVTVLGRNNETANMTIMVVAPGSAPSQINNIGVWNATRGETFSHRVPRPWHFECDDCISIDLGSLATWLVFDKPNSLLRGRVPETQPLGQFNISVRFGSNITTSISMLTINVIDAAASATCAASIAACTTACTSCVTNPTTPSSIAGSTTQSQRSKNTLALKIVLPLILILLLAVTIICHIRYRSIKRRYRDGEAKPHITESDEPAHNNPESKDDHSNDVHKSKMMPQVTLSWAPGTSPIKRHHENEVSSGRHRRVSASGWDDLISPALIGSEEDVVTGLPVIHVPRQRPLTLTSHRQSDIIDRWKDPQRSQQIRASSPSSAQTLSTIGLPKRLSGAGHGAGINTALTQSGVRSSWYTTFGSLHQGFHEHDSTLLNQFPVPARHESKKISTAPPGKVGSKARLKARLRHKTNVKPGSFEEARQQYYADRARDRLEGASRFSNSSLKGPLRSKLNSEDSIRRFGRFREESAMVPSALNSPFSQRTVGSAYSTDNFSQRGTHLMRQASVASSGQFDSAISSDSQWQEEESFMDDSNSIPQPSRTDERSSSVLRHVEAGVVTSSNGRDLEYIQHENAVRSTGLLRSTDPCAASLFRSEESLPGSFRFV